MNAHYVASANEFPINIKTAYGISKIQFSSDVTRRLLAVSTWDGFVRIIDVTNQGSPQDIRTYYHSKSVLTCSFIKKCLSMNSEYKKIPHSSVQISFVFNYITFIKVLHTLFLSPLFSLCSLYSSLNLFKTYRIECY